MLVRISWLVCSRRLSFQVCIDNLLNSLSILCYSGALPTIIRACWRCKMGKNNLAVASFLVEHFWQLELCGTATFVCRIHPDIGWLHCEDYPVAFLWTRRKCSPCLFDGYDQRRMGNNGETIDARHLSLGQSHHWYTWSHISKGDLRRKWCFLRIIHKNNFAEM